MVFAVVGKVERELMVAEELRVRTTFVKLSSMQRPQARAPVLDLKVERVLQVYQYNLAQVHLLLLLQVIYGLILKV